MWSFNLGLPHQLNMIESNRPPEWAAPLLQDVVAGLPAKLAVGGPRVHPLGPWSMWRVHRCSKWWSGMKWHHMAHHVIYIICNSYIYIQIDSLLFYYVLLVRKIDSLACPIALSRLETLMSNCSWPCLDFTWAPWHVEAVLFCDSACYSKKKGYPKLPYIIWYYFPIKIEFWWILGV